MDADKNGLLDSWITGLLDYWIIGLLDYWITGLLDIGLLDADFDRWAAQATGLCRPATRRTEWRDIFIWQSRLEVATRFSVSVGGWPTGRATHPFPHIIPSLIRLDSP